jgi:hypothetical protein
LEDALERWLLNAGTCAACRGGTHRARAGDRYRKTQIETRIREAHRPDKVLQEAGIKLSSVTLDVVEHCGGT